MASLLKGIRCTEKEGIDVKGQVIPIIVGSKNETFYVHENLLARVAFFKAALGKDGQEGQQRTINLPDDDPSTFYCYMQWLYSGRIASKHEKDLYNFTLLMQLYCYGEKVLDRGFQGRVIDAIVDATHEPAASKYPGSGAIDILYNGTPEGSPARRLVLDMYVRNAAGGWFETQSYSHGFLIDYAKAVSAGRAEPYASDKRFEEITSGIPRSYYHTADGK